MKEVKNIIRKYLTGRRHRLAITANSNDGNNTASIGGGLGHIYFNQHPEQAENRPESASDTAHNPVDSNTQLKDNINGHEEAPVASSSHDGSNTLADVLATATSVDSPLEAASGEANIEKPTESVDNPPVTTTVEESVEHIEEAVEDPTEVVSEQDNTLDDAMNPNQDRPASLSSYEKRLLKTIEAVHPFLYPTAEDGTRDQATSTDNISEFSSDRSTILEEVPPVSEVSGLPLFDESLEYRWLDPRDRLATDDEIEEYLQLQQRYEDIREQFYRPELPAANPLRDEFQHVLKDQIKRNSGRIPDIDVAVFIGPFCAANDASWARLVAFNHWIKILDRYSFIQGALMATYSTGESTRPLRALLKVMKIDLVDEEYILPYITRKTFLFAPGVHPSYRNMLLHAGHPDLIISDIVGQSLRGRADLLDDDKKVTAVTWTYSKRSARLFWGTRNYAILGHTPMLQEDSHVWLRSWMSDTVLYYPIELKKRYYSTVNRSNRLLRDGFDRMNGLPHTGVNQDDTGLSTVYTRKLGRWRQEGFQFYGNIQQKICNRGDPRARFWARNMEVIEFQPPRMRNDAVANV